MMNRLILASALLMLAAATGGCVFYGEGDDEPCALYDAVGFRNPVNGACEWGGGGGCGGAVDQAEAPGALPDMATCPGECEALDETSCQATSACRAAYLDGAFFGCWGTAPSGPVQGGGCGSLDAWECSRHDDCTAHYTGDYGQDGGGAREDGIALATTFSYCADEVWGPGCYSDMECPAGWECSAIEDCLPPPGCGDSNGDGNMDSDEAACPPVCYGRCEPAQNGCELVDCAEGYHCELQCSPCDETDPSGGGGGDGDAPEPPPGCDAACEVTCVPDETFGCEAILCAPGTHCETVCADSACPPGEACPLMCWSDCVSDVPDPGTCDGEVWCDALPPSCPVGTVAGISNGCWSGYCIPEGDCGPSDPGGCEDAICAMPSPECPVGTVAGVRNGCYTGYCIPAWQCEADQSCASLGDEASCAARVDCQPIYDGAGCTCFPDGTCSCEEWEYLRCESTGDEPVMPF